MQSDNGTPGVCNIYASGARTVPTLQRHMKRSLPHPICHITGRAPAASRLSTRCVAVMLALIYVLCLPSGAPAAGNAQPWFTIIDKNSGLPDNTVNDIAEDRYGFIWFATWHGLGRWDGKNMVAYTHATPGTHTGMAGDMVRCVCTDDNGVWAGLDNGLDFLSFKDGLVTHALLRGDDGDAKPLQARISRLLRHRGNLFAVCIDGSLLALEQPLTPNSKNLILKTVQKPTKRRYTDLASNGVRLVALSDKGLTALSADGTREMRHNDVAGLHFDTNMNIWCDSISGRIITGGGIGSSSRAWLMDRNGVTTPDMATELPGSLMSTVQMPDGEMVMGTDGHGLEVLHPGGRRVAYNTTCSMLPGDAIYTVFCDSHANVWIGTYRHGVAMYSRQLNRYAIDNIASGGLGYDIVTAIAINGHDTWLGLDGGGIGCLDRATGRYREWTAANSALPGDNVVSIVRDGDTLWAAAYTSGLVEARPEAGVFTTYRPDPAYEPGAKLWTLLQASDGALWVGGQSLHIFDKASHTFTTLPDGHDCNVLSMAEDNGCVWVATGMRGVMKFDRRSRRLLAVLGTRPRGKGGVKLPSDNAQFVHVDSRHCLWIGLSDALCRIDLDGDHKVHTYTLNPDHNRSLVASMVEDKRGNLLVGTREGLMRYIRATDTFVRLSDSRMPEYFTSNSAVMVADTAYLGTTGGLVRFPTVEWAGDSLRSSLLFTGFEILDGDGTRISLLSRGGDEIELKNSQNFFKATFSLPETSNPGSLAVQCRLEGFEDNWRDVSDTWSATYTNVPAGRYKLLLRCAQQGAWSEPVSLGVRVRNPWWLMWPMPGLWFALLLGVAWLWYKAYGRKHLNPEPEADTALTAMNAAVASEGAEGVAGATSDAAADTAEAAAMPVADDAVEPASNRVEYTVEEEMLLQKVRDAIDRNLRDEEFDVATLASEMAMSHSSLYKKIRRITGMSIIDFVNGHRIERAERMFRAGEGSVQNVAQECGFRDIKTFREAFKRHKGMPPKQFVLSLRK